MSILVGIICLLFMCSSIVIVSSFPISQYQKDHHVKKTKGTDYYSLLFNVYNETTHSKKFN
jgi:hypothetical protein